jgi:NAD+ kinase
MSRPTVLLVAKRTAWANHVERSPNPLVLGLLQRQDPTVTRMKAAHEAHLQCLRVVEQALREAQAEVRLVDDLALPLPLDGVSLLLTVGGDGTLLHASHQVASTPVLGVNSAPGLSIGFFCGADASTIDRLLPLALAGQLPAVPLHRMEVLCNDVVLSSRVLNEALFCNSCPAATSRYLLDFRGHEEEQRSSGLWVGPAAGSTAALRSAGGEVLPLDSDLLQFVVREPYLVGGRPYQAMKSTFSRGEALRVRSKMYDGALYMDGIGRSFPVTLGDRVEFRLGPEPLRVFGLAGRRGQPFSASPSAALPTG